MQGGSVLDHGRRTVGCGFLFAAQVLPDYPADFCWEKGHGDYDHAGGR